MKTLVRAVALSALIAMPTAAAVQAQTQTQAPAASRMFDATTLNLSAYGETRIAPDEATVTLGVQTKAATAAQAMADNATQMSAVMAALRNGGIAAKDIQTSNLSLEAQYDYEQNQPPRLIGYQASNTVSVTVEDLRRLGPVIDTVTAAGVNQINGVSFGLQDPSAAEDAARLDAVKALSAKAALYAQATGYRVARLVNLSESGGYSPEAVQPMIVTAMRVKAAPSTPVSGGELTVRIDINGIYELAR
jgi:uncharacterized protein